jgi:hypothetical protein
VSAGNRAAGRAQRAQAGVSFVIMKLLRKSRISVALLAVVGLPVALVGWNLHTFHRLTDEAPIAVLRFVQLAPQRYSVELRSGDFCEPRRFQLSGDQWRLDARFLKWKPMANLFGLDAMYRLDRLDGRYSDIDEANARRTVAYDIADKPGLDLTDHLDERWLSWTPVDTLFGSSVYESIDPDYEYVVYRSQSGLLVRRQLIETARYQDGSLVIPIEQSCN